MIKQVILDQIEGERRISEQTDHEFCSLLLHAALHALTQHGYLDEVQCTYILNHFSCAPDVAAKEKASGSVQSAWL